MRVYSSMSGQKEDFRPISPPRVSMYVCGITPYATSHFGHGMSAVVFDTIRRYLVFRGYDVRYVQNFTDIEDKIIDRSRELGVDSRDLVARHTAEYFDALRELNVMPAYVYPRATGELDKILEMIAGLVATGHAYAVDGDVYFRVRSAADYGKLTRRSLDDLIAGARVEVDERKENPADFALWKKAKPGEPTWPSPWSDGRPGWHIECSAMGLRYLGEQIDIHGGGQDLQFPHHENEIAQSEAFTGKTPFVRYWMHNGFILFNDTKMSKSLGNVVALPEALAAHGGPAVRLFVLQSHYRAPLSLSDEALSAARRAIERLAAAAAIGPERDATPAPDAPVIRAREVFIVSMDDDFNSPGAIAALFDIARDANRQREAGDLGAAAGARETLRELAAVLGLRLTRAESIESGLAAAPFVDLLLTVRRELRAARNFGQADAIRDRLTELGLAIEDRPDGTTWRPA
ncbi:MAG: cysteine--tRNA ligase [Chloroflexota bacterium]|nr:MAG: cysteine--tRNA ligase [Chloroflexota bacterium]